MLAAAAAHDAVTGIGLDAATIKWPNDILIGGKKLAGILVHARHGDPTWTTVGLGVNLGPVPAVADQPPHPPTSVSEHLQPVEIESWSLEIATTFVVALCDSLRDSENALASWRRHLVHRLGETLAVRLSSGEVERGTFAGLTDDGFLRLRQGDIERVITGGDLVDG